MTGDAATGDAATGDAATGVAATADAVAGAPVGGTAPTVVRPARAADVAAVAAIADAKRRSRARQQPVFWRPASGALARHTPYLAGLVDDPAAVFLVAESDGRVTGFAVGRLGPAPPVYDPGGDTCVVDDAALADEDDWQTVGAALLDRVRAVAAGRGAVQVVVVAGLGDGAQNAVLAGAGLTVASQWWVGPAQPPPAQPPPDQSPPATATS